MPDPYGIPDDQRVGEYNMVWRFIDQSQSFVLGVEAGIIYERMNRREAHIESMTHAENQEELLNLANSLGYRASFVPANDDESWHVANFTRNPS